MKSIKSRVGAAASAVTVALGTVAVPTLPMTSAVALGLGGAMVSQPAHAEAGWRVCGVYAHMTGAENGYGDWNGNIMAVFIKFRTNNSAMCSSFYRDNMRAALRDRATDNKYKVLGYVKNDSMQSMDMATCESLPEKIGANEKDKCTSMSSGQVAASDTYISAYTKSSNTFKMRDLAF